MSSEPTPVDDRRVSKGEAGDQYVVVARRYRPGSFSDLVGQPQVSEALQNAIATQRIGHAYLFTGARGVGKTSTARILAKALNCAEGTSCKPCERCDICASIARGEDVDVLEIDGASNRGIDEIRQLRSNVNIRPSRGRFKIYIIDEVHMLTTPAFNALLKTLEEPPEHVKFIFCTTDPEKIPITVLSRCQRFDFAPVDTESIVDRLRFIVDSEGAAADDAALVLLAQRANGSLRDSQSLLEQLLAFSATRITVAAVHQMLGTAGDERLAQLVAHIVGRDVGAALREFDTAISDGIDVGQLVEQLLTHFRDMMAAAVGCSAEFMLQVSPGEHEQLAATGQQIGTPTLLAMAQIMDECLVRLRQSSHPRILAEVALVRICQIEDLEQLATLIHRVSGGGPLPITSNPTTVRAPRATAPSGGFPAPETKPSAPVVPNETDVPQQINGVTSRTAPPTEPDGEIDVHSGNVDEIWQQVLGQLEDLTSDFARFYDRVSISAPNRLVVSFQAGYSFKKESCERADRKSKIETTLSKIVGRPMLVDLAVLPEEVRDSANRQPKKTRRQRMRETESNPLVSRALEVFEAEVQRIEEPANKDASGG
ncbi:MAG: hypothetical protein CMJ59_08140 [Planctomycetaceae bacterium]|nr:hypothetical protein [Planctomycetaceae bacterium]